MKIASGQSLTTNLDNFMNVNSSASNQTWGGIKRADIAATSGTYGSVNSTDGLEWLKCVQEGPPNDLASYSNAQKVADEMYATWSAQGIGYFGDTAASPLFLETPYGLEVRGPNGTSTVFSPSHRFTNTSGAVTSFLVGQATRTINVPGASGSSSYVVVVLLDPQGVSQITKNATSYTVKNIDTDPFEPAVIRTIGILIG